VAAVLALTLRSLVDDRTKVDLLLKENDLLYFIEPAVFGAGEHSLQSFRLLFEEFVDENG